MPTPPGCYVWLVSQARGVKNEYTALVIVRDGKRGYNPIEHPPPTGRVDMELPLGPILVKGQLRS